MGQGFAGPVTAKESGDGWSQEMQLHWGFSSMQGWRPSMEDAHIVAPAMRANSWASTAVFGVLDGHGGEHVAQFCERHLPTELQRGPPENPGFALIEAFHRMDEMLADPANLDELRSLTRSITPQAALRSWYAHPDSIGCTAVVCCVRHDSLVVANAGDSRAVLCRAGHAVALSEDHKPNLPAERDRIVKAGGSIEVSHFGPTTQYRVNGNLNISRAIGDLVYKQNWTLGPQDQMVCATPVVQTFRRQPNDEFMILACDGVWDVLSSQEVVDHIRQALGSKEDLLDRLHSGALRLSRILEGLLDRCLSPDLQQTFGLGGDNMTAVLVVFPPIPGVAVRSPHVWTEDMALHVNEWLRSPRRTRGDTDWLCPHC